MIAHYARDAAATCAIFGFFASAWFGWAQEAPPARVRRVLMVGSALSFLAIAAGLIVMWRYWSDGTVFDSRTSPRFGIVVGIEFALAGLGAVVLGLRGRRELVPAWIALIVGVHLFPVAVLLKYPFLHIVAALVTVAALVAVPIARARGIAVSAVTGLACGTILLLSGVYSLATVPFAG
jgi:hypothetical protein